LLAPIYPNFFRCVVLTDGEPSNPFGKSILAQTRPEEEENIMANKVIVGPILNFRGVEDGKWQTSALVVTQGDATPPTLHFTGAASPVSGSQLKALGDRTVWRIDWSVDQDKDHEQKVDYSINDGEMFRYVVPKSDQSLRISYGSCFGFSSLKYMNKVQDKNAMWTVLKDKQEGKSPEDKPYHLMLMGGDQVYADAMWETVQSMKAWADRSKGERFAEPFTAEMDREVEAFYFDLYCQRWTQEVPAAVLRQIPTVMMWDDHDVFDGWGSYPQNQHESPVYQGIYKRAREHFRLFQLQAASETDLGKYAILKNGNFSYGYRIGKLGILAVDMRSERTQDQVMSQASWEGVYDWMDQYPKRSNDAPSSGEHLIVMSSIPVVYVNSNMLEGFFGWLPGQQDLEDDFKDQWVSKTHMEERLRLIHRLLLFSKETGVRVTLVSGDVHVGAIGYIESQRDPQYDEANVVNQLISSAMNHPPPSSVVIYMMEKVMGGKVEEVDRGITAQLAKFPGSSSRFIGKRNWLSLTFDDKNRIWGEWYAEGEKTPYTKVIHPVGALSS
jgi:hypothetical protein